MIETGDDAVSGTFCSQTKLIVDVAVESAASVLQGFGPEGPDSEEKQVRRTGGCRVCMIRKTAEFVSSNLSKFPEQNPTVTSGFAKTTKQPNVAFKKKSVI